MKKLMIGAAVAAIAMGASASVCDESKVGCIAWDVSMSLKSITPKKVACEIPGADVCDEGDPVYYMDNITRKIKGYLWACDYTCATDMGLVLWDSKTKTPVVIYRPIGAADEQLVNFNDVYVYGKKANKVAGTIQFTGEMDNDLRDIGIDVTASGINGKFQRGKADDDCYVKSLSGYAAGMIHCATKQVTVKTEKIKGDLCSDPYDSVKVVCDETPGAVFHWCDACCFAGYCDDDAINNLDLITDAPATGTWSMKYNKSLSKGHTPITSKIPSYAL